MKRTWKKTLAALMALVMVLSLAVFPASAEEAPEGAPDQTTTLGEKGMEPPVSAVPETIVTEDELRSAAAAGGEATIGADIVVGDSIVVGGGQTVVVDLDGHTVSVPDDQAQHSRPFLLEDGALTVKNGTLDAKGGGTTQAEGYGAYGTLFVEGEESVLTVEDCTLRNNRPWGLNVKLEGGNAVLRNAEIVSSYGGGIEVSGSTADLYDCTISQTGDYDWCSCLVSASGGGTLNVHSGTYSSTDGWGIYVFNSGATINVFGGSFTAEDESKAVLKADKSVESAPSVIHVYDGQFSGKISIASGAELTIYGGTFSDTGLEISEFEPYLADGCTVAVDNGRYVVSGPAAEIVDASGGTVVYGTLADAVAAAQAGNTIRLLRDVALAGPIKIDKTLTIDGGGYSVTGAATSAVGYRQGLFHLENETDAAATLTIQNAKLSNLTSGTNRWSAPCGVSVRASNQTVNLTDVTADTSYYSVFVGVPGGEEESVDDVMLNIADSTLTGYAAVYYRTNSLTKTIMRPALHVTDSALYGRGYEGYGNGFSTIVYNGTRNAVATIENSTLSNTFHASNADADEGVIQFNCWGAYEKDAVVTITNSVILTGSNSTAPNVIKYTCSDNLDAGNRVIIDNLTFTKGEDSADLIRAMRNGNELLATGIDLKTVLEISEYPDADEEQGPAVKLIKSGDHIMVPINTAVKENTAIPDGVAVTVSAGATVAVDEGKTLTGGSGSQLIVRGSVSGVAGVSQTGTYHWQNGTWVRENSSTGDSGSGSGSTPPPKTDSETKTEGDVTTKTETTTKVNADGSKTTEVKETSTNAATGEKTELKSSETVAKDGSVSKETLKTTTSATGAQTEEKVTATVDAKTGTSATTTVKTDETGKRTASVVVENSKDAKVVSVSAKAVKAAAGADAATMTVKTAGAAITLDAGAVAAVAAAEGEQVSIAVQTVAPEALPEAAREALGEAVVVELTITVDESKVSSFQGGSATVAVPYQRADNAKAVAVYYVDANGTLARVVGARYDGATKTVTFATGHFSLYALVEETPLAFTDVKDGDWYYDAVRYVTEAELFTGTGPDTFGPTGTMTREMLATVLWRKAGSPSAAGMSLGEFADYAAISAWAADAMRWAVSEGILTGVGEGMLSPQGAVTRQQLALILYRAAGSPQVGGMALNEFADASAVAQWASQGMTWAVQNGVVTGRGDQTLDPAGTATRAEVAAMLMRIA